MEGVGAGGEDGSDGSQLHVWWLVMVVAGATRSGWVTWLAVHIGTLYPIVHLCLLDAFSSSYFFAPAAHQR